MSCPRLSAHEAFFDCWPCVYDSQGRAGLASEQRAMTFDTTNGAASVERDYSKSFHLLRPQIDDSRGVRYVDLVKSLSPRYGRVWLDIALGYVRSFGHVCSGRRTAGVGVC